MTITAAGLALKEERMDAIFIVFAIREPSKVEDLRTVNTLMFETPSSLLGFGSLLQHPSRPLNS